MFDSELMRPWRRAVKAALGHTLPRNPLGDAIFTAAVHLHRLGRLPRWDRPVTYNEHLVRLKRRGALYDPLRQVVTDKYLAKDFVARVAGPEYVLETIDLLSSAAEIDAFEPRRRPCVIKPTHMSGRIMVLREAGEQPDRDRLKRWLGLNYYDQGREANYRYLRPRIMVEEYYVEPEDGVTHEFNMHCVGGRPRMVRCIRDRHGAIERSTYSRNWVPLPFSIKKPSTGSEPRPACLEEMLEVAERLVAPFGVLRVDFLVAAGRPKICELTCLPTNALTPFLPPDYDRLLGGLFDHPDKEIEEVLGLSSDPGECKTLVRAARRAAD